MADEKVERLKAWIERHSTSAILPGLRVLPTQHAGRGVFATEAIGASTPILTLPHTLLLNHSTVIAHVTRDGGSVAPGYARYLPQAYREEAVHADEVSAGYARLLVEALQRLLLFQAVGMYLCCEAQRETSFWAEFMACLPGVGEFDMCPLTWSSGTERLPKTAREHAARMAERYERDRGVVRALVEKAYAPKLVEAIMGRFLEAFLLINLRCLYMEIPESSSSESNFTMAPYVDFINHSAQDHCELLVHPLKGFSVSCGAVGYSPGDEVLLSYGPHSNEFLAIEYGFVLEENPWNDVDVTLEVEARVSPAQREFLETRGYWGDYTVRHSGPSFRTEVALAVMQVGDGRLATDRALKSYMDGVTEGVVFRSRSRQVLAAILEQIMRESLEHVGSSVPLVARLHADRVSICRENV